MEKVQQLVAKAVKELFAQDVEVVVSRPDEQFGDYSTNVAMLLASKLGKAPHEIAKAIAAELNGNSIAKAEVAGPGFINITLSDQALIELMTKKPAESLKGKVVVVEYSDPNPFKILHAGHLYTSVVGDAIASLLETAGAETHRVNYGGDVGLHAARTMWALLKKLGGENPEKLGSISEAERSEWMADGYIRGTAAYEDEESAKQEIIVLNKRIYKLHADDDHESPLAKIYWTCREWSYKYFDEFYARIGTKFEKYYPESEVAELGLKTVKEQLEKGVFKESDGAIVFEGEEHGLHTRVFITSEGIPTYEAKDVGLIMTKREQYHFDKSVVITGNEQEQYMQVVLKALEQFEPELVKATIHLTHGIVKMQGGVKMSSRKGNILRAVDVLDVASTANKKATGKDDQDVVLGAVKYSFLKQRTGGDIIYDPEESVALEGNSGPYLQYAHARAKSILAKSKEQRPESKVDLVLQTSERSLVRKLSEYAEVVEQATAEFMPHQICTYLYELAQTFNRFYEQAKVIGDPREAFRLKLVAAYADTLKSGLGLLGVNAPDKM